MHITGFKLTNFMRITCLDVQVPGSGAICIGAGNGHGKTSLYRFLEACFGGKAKLPLMPVSIGEKRSLGEITLDDDGRTVTIEVEVLENRTLKVKVRQDKGPAMKAPMQLLRSLVNTFTFDPFALLRLSGREQRDKFLECLGVTFVDLDEKSEKVRQERQDCGRDVHGRQKQIDAMPQHAGVPTVEVSIADLSRQVQEATAHNQTVQEAGAVAGKWDRECTEAVAALQSLREKIADAEDHLTFTQDHLAKARIVATELTAVDLYPIQQQILDAAGINGKIRANEARAALVAQFESDRDRYVELGKQLATIESEKVARLAKAKAPVDGLTFTDDGVFYDDLPLDQDSGSSQMIRAVELVAALDPTLRAIFVDDAERLLSGRLAELHAWAEKNNYQVFAFIATESTEGCQIVLEDGKAQTTDGQA